VKLNHIIVTLGVTCLMSVPIQADYQVNHPKRPETFFGIELLYLKPVWTTNPAYLVTSNNGPDQIAKQVNFDYDFNMTPVFSGGIIYPNGIGFRGRYWLLNGNDSQSTTFDNSITRLMTAGPLGVILLSTPGVTPGLFDHFSFDSTLSMQTADAEVIIDRKYDAWHILLSGGVRYAYIKQTYTVHNQGETSSINLITNHINSLQSSQFSRGFGPTISAEAGYAIGWGGLSLYGNARNSTIFGKENENASAKEVNTMIGDVDESVSTNHNTLFNIFELELGLDWSKKYKNNIEMDWRIGVVGQTWTNVGNSSNNDNLNDNFSIDQTGADNSSLNLGLIGFLLSGTIKF